MPLKEPDEIMEVEQESVSDTGSAKEERVSGAYWSLVWWKFRKNRMAIVGGVIVAAFYLFCVVLAEFMAPYTLQQQTDYLEARPQPIVFKNPQGEFSLWPSVLGLEEEIDMETRKRTYEVQEDEIYRIKLFPRAAPYKLFGLIPMRVHLFGVDPDVEEATIFLFGTDRLGRDVFSRILYGGRLSLLIGLIGQGLTVILGVSLGVISGYYGGWVDIVVQRGTEFVTAFPREPLFMALAAAIPPKASPITVYFMLTLILALVQWGGLARQVRGLILSLREREYVLAADSFGASDGRMMFRHLLPGTMSHVIVIITLMIPGMILAETALSWLGLGLRPPLTSWGVMLQEVGSVRAIRFAPWLLTPIPFVLLAILGFNLLGDGLRDALDPYGGA